ncbi:MAG TPA: acyl-CoA thioesterase [Candidatus Acidoferrales bacterium]|nr:acyl-CoA thioesterase [Candidatus Acidoferrales bacterium]
MPSEKAAGTAKGAAAAARKGKPVSASLTELVEVVLPNDANVLGNILGGRVMHLIDITGAIAAHRHANSHVVTASVDYIDFRNPIKVGELIILKSRVNRVFRTSIEVGVDVFSENVLTGRRIHTSSAFVTYVAIDEAGRPTPIRPLILRTAAERRRFREAGFRRRIRLAHRAGRGLGAEAARLSPGRR